MSTKTAMQLQQRHPLQRLHSPSRGASAMLHLLGLLSFLYSFNWLIANPNPINASYGWHFQYLTILGLSLSLLTFLTALLSDITSSPLLFRLKNFLSVLSAPMEVLISVLYWGLRIIDRRLVLPDWAPVIPLSTDISFHLAPAVALSLDLLFFSPPYTVSALPALGMSSAIAVSYWFWVEECYKHNGWYPYPIFEQSDVVDRGLLFGGSALVMSLSTLSLKWIYGRVNGKVQDGKMKPS